MRSRSPKLKAPSPQRSGLCSEESLRSLAPLYAAAIRSRVLHLTALGLRAVPEHAFSARQLIRLDVSHNELGELSPSVGLLTNLIELWANANPLRALPPELEKCHKLQVLDLRDTAVRELPTELGRLTGVVDIDLRGTPYAQYHDHTDTKTLMRDLARRDRRRALERELIDKASAGVYREVAGERRAEIRALTAALADEFEDLADLRDVVRNCDRLLPKDPVGDQRTAARRVRQRFTQLRRDNDRKRLSADLELKLRGLYYDNIDPAKVEGYIADVYDNGPDERRLELEDVQFLVKHAPRLFPPDDPSAIRGADVRSAVWSLQASLDSERAACVADVANALLAHLYSDVEPPLVHKLAKDTCDQFQRERFATKAELRELKKLAADATTFFPPEFHNAKPHKIKAAFKNRGQDAPPKDVS